MRRSRTPLVTIASIVLLCAGCAAQRPVVSEPAPSPYRPAALGNATDDLTMQSLAQGASASLAWYEGAGRKSPPVTLGNDRYDSDALALSARRVIAMVKQTPASELPARLAGECRAYTTSGPATFTAYYEPSLEARRQSDARFRYPIYRAPDEFQRALLVQHFRGFPKRVEIDVRHALEGMGLELAWVDDPVALYFLHVQGSGRLVFDDGSSMHIGFAGSNEAGYRSVGEVMLSRGLLPKGNASAEAMKAWLRAHPDQRDELLYLNPRYIFFRTVDGSGPVGSLGVALVAGRSLATDPQFVPPGVLTFFRTQQPSVAKDGRVTGWRPVERFAFSHDAGAAIRGPARADIFWGSGETAGLEAGSMHQSGDLYVLVCGEEKHEKKETQRHTGTRVQSASEHHGSTKHCGSCCVPVKRATCNGRLHQRNSVKKLVGLDPAVK